jgi:phosphoribosylformylglycinamidine synthase
MGEFYESCRGLGDMARTLKLPFVSGNVSFYNESLISAVPPTPELVGIGIVNDIRQCVTTDFKKVGNPIYLVGRPTDVEFGGSAYNHIFGINTGCVPQTDAIHLSNCMDLILSANHNEFLASCHDVSEGGIGVAISEMCIGGDIGCNIDISSIQSCLTSVELLFSESNTRWIAEVHSSCQTDFEILCAKKKIPAHMVGNTYNDRFKCVNKKKTLFDLAISDLRKAWNNTLWKTMG